MKERERLPTAGKGEKPGWVAGGRSGGDRKISGEGVGREIRLLGKTQNS